jgi:Pectate lyase superfamily protein
VLAQGGVYNVQTYGAKGDGSTNNAAAINSAFAAAALTCGIVYFPSAANAYVIKSQITWPRCVSIRGDGPPEGGFAGTTIRVVGKFVGILAQSPTDGSYPKQDSSYPKQGFIEEIGFSGQEGALSAFRIIARSHIVIRHVFVNNGGGNFAEAGIRLASNLG